MPEPHKFEGASSLVPEAWMDRTFLPRCATCLTSGRITPHPLAHQPPIRTGRCPVCDTPATTGATIRERAPIASTPETRIGRALLAIGWWLTNLARGI